jgi:hypothetical protein
MLALPALVVGLLLAQSSTAPASAPPHGDCAVSHSLAELKRAFAQGRAPSPTELTGSWVEVGDFSQPSGPEGKEFDTVDCAGLKGTTTLQTVLLVNGYVVEPRMVANEWNTGDRQVFKRDGRDSVTFGLGLGGDGGAYYRCRLTKRRRLACLVEPYYSGVEFMKMRVRPDQLCVVKALVNGWRLCLAPEQEGASAR